MTFVILESLVLVLCWLKLEEDEVDDEKEVEEDDEDVEEVPFRFLLPFSLDLFN
tara:strand:- start:184 stop:345 length:162 start_codon:yes stop_codon:yes gene_type:complete